MNKIAGKAISFILLGSLLGCGQAGTEPTPAAGQACSNTLVPIEVDFTWEPSALEAGDEALLSAHVTHDGLAVDQANEVKFEIWEHANPDYHHMIEAENAGDGFYTLPWSFDTDGVYYVYYHVTACDMHRMEKELVIIGDVDVDAVTSEPDTVVPEMNHGDHGSEEVEESHKHNH